MNISVYSSSNQTPTNMSNNSYNTNNNNNNTLLPSTNNRASVVSTPTSSSRIQSMFQSAKLLGQTTTLQANIALWEREIKQYKQSLGVDVYDILDHYYQTTTTTTTTSSTRTRTSSKRGTTSSTSSRSRAAATARSRRATSARDRVSSSSSSRTTNRNRSGTHSNPNPNPAQDEDDTQVQQQEEDAMQNIFYKTKSEITKLLDARNEKQSLLVRQGKPKALCYEHQSTGESTVSEDSTTRSTPTRSLGGGFFQKFTSRIVEQAKATTSVVQLKSEIASLDRQILDQKRLFGIQFYDWMDTNTQLLHSTPVKVVHMFQQARRDISIPLSKSLQAAQEIQSVQTLGGAAGGGTVYMTQEDIRNYLNSKPSLWIMLEANICMEEDVCKEVAYRVAMELLSGKKGLESLELPISKRQFSQFCKQYVDDPKGSLEFFHRCVFAAFDDDGDGVLDKDETDRFLDTFYMTGSIFRGDARLPSQKEDLKALILEKLDENGDGVFSFEEIRSLISGSASISLIGLE